MILLALFACSPDAAKSEDTGSEIAWEGAVSLDTDYTVPVGTTLTIAPGTTVSLSAGVALIVDGELLAQGTADAPILFTGDAAAPWRSLVFDAGGSDASFDGFDAYASGSIVENAVVENATRGMELAGASPYLHAVTFQDNVIATTMETIGGAALLISDGAVPRVRDCIFDGNVANAFAFGGAIYVDHADPILQDDVFTDNSSSYGGAIATDFMASPIVGSRFDGNSSISDGGAISLVSSVSPLLGNTVTGNHAAKDGAGVHVCVDCDPHAAPYLLDNVITGNTSDDADPDEAAAGVGAAFLGAMESNDIHDNLRDGSPSDFSWFNLAAEAWPDWVASPELSDNWWGSADPADVAATVWDGSDSALYSVLRLDPIEGQANTGPIPRAVVATRELRYTDAGDDVPVFLTLYNPGAETTVSLSLVRAGIPFDGTLDVPGATVDGDRWDIDLPEDAVWFGEIDDSSYDGASTDDVSWEATLYATGTGAVIGAPSEARYVFQPATGS